MPVLYLYFEGLAFFCSILLLSKNIEKFYKLFFAYCSAVLVAEYIAKWMILDLHLKSNHIVYAVAVPLFLGFYLIALRHFLITPVNKKISNLFLILFYLFWLLDISVLQDFKKFPSYTLIFGCVLSSVSCVLYFIELINKNSIISIKKEPSFFIVSGLFFYSILTALVFTLTAYFAYQQIAFDQYRRVTIITLDVSNVVLYLLLSIAFIIKWNQRKL